MKTAKKAFVLGKNYTHFAVNKLTNQIITGWDYKNIDTDELREFRNDYFVADLIDMDIEFSTTKILNRKNTEKLVSDITDSNNWQK